ncbi:hypothetical protein STEG23_017100 [Scotinomys teguina]
MDRSDRSKLNREIKDLADVMEQMDLIDIYRTFHPTKKEYTFFSAPPEIFSMIEHILGHKTNFNSYKIFGTTSCILSDYYGLKIDFNNNKNYRKSTISWKLNNAQLKHQWRLDNKRYSYIFQDLTINPKFLFSGSPKDAFTPKE